MLFIIAILAGVEYQPPRSEGEMIGHHEADVFVMGIYEQQEVVVLDRLAAGVALAHRLSREIHAEAARVFLLPFFVAHLFAVGGEPDDVAHAAAFDALPLEKAALTDHWVPLAQRDQLAYELDLFLILRR